MTRHIFGWTWILIVLGLAGCNSLRRDADVSRDQWEPDVQSAAR